MNPDLFAELLESIAEMGAVRRGEIAAARTTRFPRFFTARDILESSRRRMVLEIERHPPHSVPTNKPAKIKQHNKTLPPTESLGDPGADGSPSSEAECLPEAAIPAFIDSGVLAATSESGGQKQVIFEAIGTCSPQLDEGQHRQHRSAKDSSSDAGKRCAWPRRNGASAQIFVNPNNKEEAMKQAGESPVSVELATGPDPEHWKHKNHSEQGYEPRSGRLHFLNKSRPDVSEASDDHQQPQKGGESVHLRKFGAQSPARTWALIKQKARRAMPRRTLKDLCISIIGLFRDDVNPARPIPEERPRRCPLCNGVRFPKSQGD